MKNGEEKKSGLRYSKQVSIFLKFDLLERIESYWHGSGFANRNRAIIHLLEKGLDAEEKESEN